MHFNSFHSMMVKFYFFNEMYQSNCRKMTTDIKVQVAGFTDLFHKLTGRLTDKQAVLKITHLSNS